MSKVDSAVRGIATRLMSLHAGDQLPTTAALASELGVGFGTVHAALQRLQRDHEVMLTTHGHCGTVLAARDIVQLWQASERGSLTGVLPLPRSLEFAGIATAISEAAEVAGLPLNLTFRQGARGRLRVLLEGRVDWALMSHFAAQLAREQAEAPLDILLLPDHTYYSADTVVVLTRTGERPEPHGRVAVDRASFDHLALTEGEFPEAKFVDVPHLRLPESVAEGRADAAVWHLTSPSWILTGQGLEIHTLSRPSPAQEMGQAALVYPLDDRGTASVLSELFDPEQLALVQREVVAGIRRPVF